MGMYTKLHISGLFLTPDLPAAALTLDRTNNQIHPFFDCPRWQQLVSGATLTNVLHRGYTLDVQCEIKDYDDEIAKFLDWLSPWIDVRVSRFVGYHQEEDDDPILIYVIRGETKERTSMGNTYVETKKGKIWRVTQPMEVLTP